MTNVKGATMTSSTRSSFMTFELDPPRPVERKPSAWCIVFGDVMVVKVSVSCSWATGGYSLSPGYPAALITGEEGETLFLSELAFVPDWLSEIIAAGTPTDLEHPAS